MARDADAATAAAQALLGTEETEEVAEEVEEVEEFQFPTFDVVLDDEDEEELDEEEDDGEDLYSEFSDTDPELLARLRAAERRSAHLEKLRVADGKKGWAKEAAEKFPLSQPLLGDIKATSRTAYMKEAKAYHNKLAPFVQQHVIDPYTKGLEKKVEEITAEQRDVAAKAWGKPAIDATPVPADVTASNEAIKRARARGDLTAGIKAMIFPQSKEA